jgi:hypothetical protein
MPAQSATDLRALDLKDIARRWHDLAERRLAAYNELYRSGRWKHYYPSQEQFAARMLEVIRVARAYHKIAGDPAPAAPRQDPRAAPLRPAA